MPEPYRVVSALPQGTAIARYIQALALGCDDMFAAVQKAERWLDTPQVKAALVELRTKAAVAAGSTTDATWAGPLSVYGIAQEAITILRGRTILGALEGQMQKVPLHVKVPIETGAGFSGGWVAEGAAVPVQKTAFAASTQEFYKYGVITPLSEELVTTSDPAAVPVINRTVLGGLGKGIDTQILTPTIALSAGNNPASILNGSTEITTTGTTAAQIAADLAGMLAAVTSPGALVWIMKPKTMYLARVGITSGRLAEYALRDSGDCLEQFTRPNRPDRSQCHAVQ
jgi:HK97 family phage major capsid protein